MHFCSVLHFAKANHNRATLCLSFAHLLYSAPLLYFTFLFRASPIRIFALTYFANALHFFTTHCSAALFHYLAMRNLSLLCLCKAPLRQSMPFRYNSMCHISNLRLSLSNLYCSMPLLCLS
nr:MAG TPA: hypothetical protein [Herelleviridae sp.]